VSVARIVGSSDLIIRNQKFRGSFPVFGPGAYDIEVEVSPVLPATPPLTEDLKKSLFLRSRWTSQYTVWKTGLPEVLASEFPRLRSLILDIREHIDSLEASTVSEDRWIADRDSVRSECWKLRDRAGTIGSFGGTYPATYEYLRFVIGRLNRNNKEFIFRDGKLEGAGHSTHALGQAPMGGGVRWNEFRGALDETLKIAGREFALWTLKLLRASPEKIRPEVKASIA